MKYTSISNIEASKPHRITTGEPELDWLYGVSNFPNGQEFGMPVGTISTWVGEGGVGKSRLAIKVAKYKVQKGSTVLYLQNEVDLSTLASWVGANTELKNFYCSEVTALSEQIEVIKELKPELVFVDSINLINEFGTGTAVSIKTIIDGFRSVIRETGSHIVILCQLNKQNEATGSTALGHLPDTNLVLTNYNDDFMVSIGKKNRYGPKGSKYFGIWRHLTNTVECISNNRVDLVSPIKNTSILNECEDIMLDMPDMPLVDMPIIERMQKEQIPLSSDTDVKVIDLINATMEVRELFFDDHPELRESFYRDYPRLKPNIWEPAKPYGSWGLLGRVVENLFNK